MSEPRGCQRKDGPPERAARARACRQAAERLAAAEARRADERAAAERASAAAAADAAGGWQAALAAAQAQLEEARARPLRGRSGGASCVAGPRSSRMLRGQPALTCRTSTKSVEVARLPVPIPRWAPPWRHGSAWCKNTAPARG
jgi:hypothetical protein